MDKCAKCGREDDGWLLASVDINDSLCINCCHLFDEWCMTHPGEPYRNFIQPKPWNPRPKLRSIVDVLDEMPWDVSDWTDVRSYHIGQYI